LLARLQTRELAINALRKAGKEAEANEIEKLQKAINKDILKAFRLNFKFAPVYFFMQQLLCAGCGWRNR